jgi:hypothetical protein
VCLCGNEHTANFYRAFIPGKYVHNSLRLDIIEEYWAWCDSMRALRKPIPHSLFILDDVLVTASSKKYNVTRTSQEHWLNRLWAEGRHQNIACVLSVQSLSVGLPFVRCSDVFICFPSAFYAGQDWKMLTENYMPIQSTREASAIADCFTQFECMVCQYHKQESRRWETRIKWYKVDKDIALYDAGLDDRIDDDLSAVRPRDQSGNELSKVHTPEACANVPTALLEGECPASNRISKTGGRSSTTVHDRRHKRNVVNRKGKTVLASNRRNDRKAPTRTKRGAG